MNKRLLIGFVFLNTLFLSAQNVVDENGLKAGNWVYYSTNGSQEKILVYEYGDLIKTRTKENGVVKTIQH